MRTLDFFYSFTFSVADFAKIVEKNFDNDLANICICQDPFEKSNVCIPSHTVHTVIFDKNMESIQTGKTFINNYNLGVLWQGFINQTFLKIFFD